jgi:hypothetical protein
MEDSKLLRVGDRIIVRGIDGGDRFGVVIRHRKDFTRVEFDDGSIENCQRTRIRYDPRRQDVPRLRASVRSLLYQYAPFGCRRSYGLIACSCVRLLGHEGLADMLRRRLARDRKDFQREGPHLRVEIRSKVGRLAPRSGPCRPPLSATHMLSAYHEPLCAFVLSGSIAQAVIAVFRHSDDD